VSWLPGSVGYEYQSQYKEKMVKVISMQQRSRFKPWYSQYKC